MYELFEARLAVIEVTHRLGCGQIWIALVGPQSRIVFLTNYIFLQACWNLLKIKKMLTT